MRVYVLALIIALWSVSLVHAFCPIDATPPPASYQGAYIGPLEERPLPQHEIIKACRHIGVPAVGRGLIMAGCQQEIDGVCIIIYIKSCENFREHELAHCGGWRHRSLL